jgi:hypothetical protein
VNWVDVLAGFLVAHMVGDYLLQTDWQARHKRGGLTGDATSRRALWTHVTTYTLAFVPVLVWMALDIHVWVGVLAAALIFLPHLGIDDGRVVEAYLRHVKRADVRNVGLATSVDQALHVVCLWLVALLAGLS